METNVEIEKTEKKCSTLKKAMYIVGGIALAGAGVYLANRFGLISKLRGTKTAEKAVEAVAEKATTAVNGFNNSNKIAKEAGKVVSNNFNKGGMRV